MKTIAIQSPPEMIDLINKIKKEALDKHGLKITGVQAQQVMVKSYLENQKNSK